MSRSETQVQSPRLRIVEGAKQAFLTFGYDGASMRIIAECTGYSQAGISHYFATKSDLLLEAFSQSCAVLESAFNVENDLDITTKLYRIWRQMSRFRVDIALWGAILAEASTLQAPGPELARKAWEDFQATVHKAFPEIPSSSLFSDCWIGLMIDWLYHPRLDIAYLLKECYLTLSIENDFPRPNTVEAFRSDQWSVRIRDVFSTLKEKEVESEPPESRKGEIIAAATEIFGNCGYIRGSLRAIANSLGITHPALLRHYPSKDRLFQAVISQRNWMALPRTVPASPRLGITDGLAQMEEATAVPGLVGVFIPILARSYAPTSAFHSFFERCIDSFNEVSTALFEGLGESGELRPDLDPTAGAHLYEAIWYGSQVRWFLDGTRPVGELIGYLNQMLVPPLSAAEIDRITSHSPVTD